jgi:hypothetical protein
MTDFNATIVGSRSDGAAFLGGRYSRAPLWRFDGGAATAAHQRRIRFPCHSASPRTSTPRKLWSLPSRGVTCCLSLSLAAKRGFVVDHSDAARATMARNAQGRMAMTKVTLNPRIEYAGRRPDRAMQEHLHHLAHEPCYIGNSVTTEVETRRGSSEHSS